MVRHRSREVKIVILKLGVILLLSNDIAKVTDHPLGPTKKWRTLNIFLGPEGVVLFIMSDLGIFQKAMSRLHKSEELSGGLRFS